MLTARAALRMSASSSAASAPSSWRLLVRNPPGGAKELSLPLTLTNGQSFGWKMSLLGGSDSLSGQLAPAFTGVLGTSVVTLRERGDDVEYCARAGGSGGGDGRHSTPNGGAGAPAAAVAASSSSSGSTECDALHAALSDYFQLRTPLAPLYTAWAASDARLAALTTCLPGMRVLRQPPLECLLSFICSSNNNIARITQMLDKLRARYGEPLGTVDGVAYHAFPTLSALAQAQEAELRQMGFGYRAKFIVQTVAALQERGGDAWLEGLRQLNAGATTAAAESEASTASAASGAATAAAAGTAAEHLQDALVQLSGVGRKVADCVALFSLDTPGALPVDTHVWTVACRYYDASLRDTKSLTPAVYKRVGDLFRARFGAHAGWAHCLLFAAELPAFRDRLPPALVAEMAAMRAGEQAAKAAAAREKKKARSAAATAVGAAGAGNDDDEGDDDNVAGVDGAPADDAEDAPPAAAGASGSGSTVAARKGRASATAAAAEEGTMATSPAAKVTGGKRRRPHATAASALDATVASDGGAASIAVAFAAEVVIAASAPAAAGGRKRRKAPDGTAAAAGAATAVVDG
jgi:N-glycosylase/DNA lyase